MASMVATWMFNLSEGVGIAVQSIVGNKVRAGLTILGIAVGVFVVVVIAAAVHGINTSVASALESAGPKTFFISRYPIVFGAACDGTDATCTWRHNPPLTMADQKLINALPSVLAAGARLDLGLPVKYADRTHSAAQISAFTSNWVIINGGGDVNPGRSWTQNEADAGNRLAVINDVMATQLFGQSDPIDKLIAIGGQQFRVIGLYHAEANFLGGDRSQAFVPIETAFRVLNAGRSQISISVVPLESATRGEAMDEVTALLRQHHGLRPATDNDFALITQDKVFDTYNKVFGMFFLVMIVLSGIGLIVGGVGVVAIMMISVTERTREIGVRKALGATRATILWQFLVEAVTLTGIGAVIGL
ncbi:MAG: ABC transporter permease, partial [Gemmatimonadaceae bacterium]